MKQMTNTNMVAVVTGASRGLGRAAGEALARQGYTVIMAMRNPDKKMKDMEKLKSEGLKIVTAELDVADTISIGKFISFITKTFNRCDVLINNAGIFNDDTKTSGSPLSTAIDVIKKSLETNTFGPLLMIQGLVPFMKNNGYGRIVNVSSGMGSFDEMDRGYISYRMSKTALNVITKLAAAEFAGTDILINSVCPGWVKTDMGGPGAERLIPEGISGILWAATIPKGGPSGGFFRDGKQIKW
jgi:NAD(P)-dependent dehydrogenase (short-subunit alcohol dehydrogenase family)